MEPPKPKKARPQTRELLDAEAIGKQFFGRLYKWVLMHFGLRAARTVYGFFVILVVLMLLLDDVGKIPQAEKSLDIIPGISSLSEAIHNRFHPIPKADLARFSVALVHLQNDRDRNMEGFISRALKNFEKPLGAQFLQFDRTITLPDQTDASERIGHERAREYLKESHADVLIWGVVWTVNHNSEAQLYYTTTQVEITSAQAYRPEDFKLPIVDRQELTDILGLLVATQSADLMAEEGKLNVGQLESFIQRVQVLLHGTGSKDWNSDTRTRVSLLLADALLTLGQKADSVDALSSAIAIYREVLVAGYRKNSPLDWAGTQENLGVALWTLGQRRADITQLEQAVIAFHEALEEFTRDRDPSNWAGTQLNLGNALNTLGKRESNPQRLEQAATAYCEALEVRTRDRVPLDWAMTQNDLGVTLKSLGEMESSTILFERAIATYREALKEFTRDRVPLYWAMTQNNLGSALVGLGTMESNTLPLQEAVAAFHGALQEHSRERDPMQWAAAQSNLGNALAGLGKAERNRDLLQQAVVAYREALKEQTRERSPLDWAKTEGNLAITLSTLGSIESKTSLLEEAVVAYREALKVQTLDSAPLKWGSLHYSIGTTLLVLGLLNSNTQHLEEADVSFREALTEQTREGAPVDWAWTQYNLGQTLSVLGGRKGNAAMVCESVGNFLGAWEVFSSTAPYQSATPQIVKAVNQSMTMLKKVDRSMYSQCITKYADILKRMNKV
jgi:tetratricopeptide (TPR) repeat protein